MEELLAAANREYGLAADTIKPFHSVWRLTSPKGLFILKKMGCLPERITWLQLQMQRLSHSGFPNLIPFLTTRNGRPYMLFQNQPYIISAWKSGTPPVFTNLNHLKQAAAVWGRLHCSAQQADAGQLEPGCDHLEQFQAKTHFLTALLQQLGSQNKTNRIDRSIAAWGEYFLNQAALSLHTLTELNYRQWRKQTDAIGFCHNDPAPRNIIIHNQEWFLIDFELSGVGLFLNEWALLIRRALQANQWNFDLIAPLFQSYQAQRGEATEEARLLPAILCFPQAFWRLCSQRYEESLKWTEKHFQSRLWEITHQEPQRLKLLQHWFGELTSNLNISKLMGVTNE